MEKKLVIRKFAGCYYLSAVKNKPSMDEQQSVITAIVTGIVAIAGLIFRAKQKRKVTRRKTKELNHISSPEKKEVNNVLSQR